MSKILRKGAHVGVGFFALLFAVLPPGACLALAFAALLHNAMLVPRYARWLWRESDHRLGYSPGVVAYSVTLILLCVAFWNRPDIAAAGWGLLAFGDGSASIAGRAIGGPRLPWNREKSWAGFAAFALFGSGACFLLASFVRSHGEGFSSLPHANLLLASVVAGITGAVIESIPQALDDNIAAPLAGAAAFALVDSFDSASWSASMAGIQARILPFVSLSLLLGVLAWKAKTVCTSGLAAGVALASITGVFGGPAMFAALSAFWMTAQSATRVGWARKANRGIAQSNLGRRGARHAIAKLGVPTLLMIFERGSPGSRPFEVAALSALAAAACDTVATEIGQLSREKPRRLPLLTPVSPGTPGGMTLLGWSAGIIAAALVILAAWIFGGVSIPRDFALILGAAISACWMESAIGAFLIPRRLIGKTGLNLLLSAAAAAFGWTAARGFP